MDSIDQLMAQYPQFDYRFMEMPDGLDGLTINGKIMINKELSDKEKLQWLYEEIGHALTSSGDITDYWAGNNYQQESRARNWGMKHCIPRAKLKEIEHRHVDEDYEIADDLGIQIEYLHHVGLMYGYHFKSIN